MGKEVAEEIRTILMADEAYPFLTSRAQTRLGLARIHWHDILHSSTLPIQEAGREWSLHTFAGDRINILLARSLAQILGCEVDGDSFSLRIKSPEQVPLREEDILLALETINQPDFFSPERITAMVRSLPRGRLSKFQPLLPPELEAQFLAERLFDVKGLRHWLRAVLPQMS